MTEIDESLRRSIWHSKLHAHHNVRYYGALYKYHRRAERFLQSVVVASSLGSIGVWLSSLHPLIWQTASASAALSSLIILIWDLQNVIVKSKEMHNRWLSSHYEWDALWDRAHNGSIQLSDLEARREEDLAIDREAVSLPDWDWLVESTHAQMERALGLDTKQNLGASSDA